MNVAVVGSGFTGTMVAAHLLMQTRTTVTVTVLERTGRFGPGVAYSTPFAAHLLNVQAERMSAFPGDPGHFLRWASREHPGVRPDSFLPRQWYAAYLADVLDQAKETGKAGGSRLQRLDAEVVGIVRRDSGQWQLACSDGQHLVADIVVLAIGNYPPANPPVESSAFYTTDWYRQDPWAPDALTVDAQHDVLVLGTGLTMIDVVIALDEQGHRGKLTCVSRRALLPQRLREGSLGAGDVPPPLTLATWPRTMRGLVREFRREVEMRMRAGEDWRHVVASVRRATPSLWASLPAAERRRFLRHVRPYWDTHRHGVAPAIARRIDDMRQSGRLRVIAGRVLGYETGPRAAEVRVQLRGGRGIEQVRVQRVINCTGPDANVSRVSSPLVQHLFTRGMISPDPLGIGIVSDGVGRVVDAQGVAQAGLYLAGPLRRGQTWENVAVPELREGAAGLAEHLIRPGVSAATMP
jgi:uncharacterized NAD(P)/FAD-binding protein YdhS